MFERTDIWREGTWLDLWSVVHFLSGVSIGFGFYFLPFGVFGSFALAFVSLVAYEMWEVIVHIEEAPTNRMMDVVVGMASFIPTYLFLAPHIVGPSFLIVFGVLLVANVGFSVVGWQASQKAATLEANMRARYETERTRLKLQKARLRRRFRHRTKDRS